MGRVFFGLSIKSCEGYNAQDVAARLFLCPRIAPAQVPRMLEMLYAGKLSLASFMAKTEEGLAEFFRWKATGEIDIPAFMRAKIETWSKVFKAPKEQDYAYLEKKYGITKSDLFGGKADTPDIHINSAKELADYVKQYIKGQDLAIEQLSVPFFQHLDSKRNHYTCRIKTPVLLMGPTGVGKSEVLRIFGKVCDCPVVRINTRKVTPNGWTGKSISDIIAKQLSDTVTIKDLEYAIIVFHEFDKITHYGRTIVGTHGTDGDADMMGDIMSLVETDDCIYLDCGFDNHKMDTKCYKLPVDNLLILFDGAFQGIESIIKKRLNIGSSIGFSSMAHNKYEGVNLQSLVTDEDLLEWGYTPELIGRIGNTIVMNPLSTEDIYQIMKSAKDSVIQFHREQCQRSNIDLHFTDDALYYIATEAQKSGLGFRIVKTILAKTLRRLYYDFPPKSSREKKRTIEISKDYVMKSIRAKQQ